LDALALATSWVVSRTIAAVGSFSFARLIDPRVELSRPVRLAVCVNKHAVTAAKPAECLIIAKQHVPVHQTLVSVSALHTNVQ
jgi:hypothetical protein